MANNIQSVRWQIDTLAFTYPYRLYILSAEWTDAVTIGDTLLVVDNNGKPIFSTKAYAVNYQQQFPKQGWVNGLTVTTLTSGILFINVGGAR